jgi:aldose 1-epimerase
LSDASAFRPIWLRDALGLEAAVIPYGATLVRLRAPDRSGRLGDVVLGLADLAGYAGAPAHLGATVGRCANRIARARFTLDSKCYTLEANDGANHIHGGSVGFSRVVWSAEPFGDGTGVRLRYLSPDGEAGYPGNLEVGVAYALDGAGGLRIEFRATTDAPTVVSLTNHSYFNLADAGATAVLDHELAIAASRYTPVDARGIPTGAIEPVAGTALDFGRPRRIGERLEELIASRGGYDHNYALDQPGLERVAARVYAPASGRVLEVRTTLPGLQLYTANGLDGSLACTGGVRPGRWSALCLEAQLFPDAPNQPAFPSARLDPGAVYQHTSVYSLSIE